MRIRSGGTLSAIPIIVIVAAFAVLSWNRRWVSEDAFISLRVVDNILEGRGPVYNAGERVEAGTSPGWIFLLVSAAFPLRFIDVEWIALVLGLAMSVAGLFIGSLAGHRLLALRPEAVSVPIGAMLVAAVPAFWDFASSGLETGLTFLWLALSLWGLQATTRRDPTAPRPRWWVPLCVGLGPLIRPDLAVFTLLFFLAVVALARPRSTPTYLKVTALTGAIPVIYQVFRMGYFANLVPNPALAKEASLAHWERGFAYLGDYFGVYWLWIPVLAIAIALGVMILRWRPERSNERILVVATVIGASLLHSAFVVRVGGDFMHGRLLLPGTFAFALLGWVYLRTIPGFLLALVVVGWAAFCSLTLRVPYAGELGPKGIADERGIYSLGHPDLVTLEDYRPHPWLAAGESARQFAKEGGRTIFLRRDDELVTIGLPETTQPVVLINENVGILGYGAGEDVWVADRFGLADPIAGRILLTHRRNRAGHEKNMDPGWVLARLGIAGSENYSGELTSELVAAARSALRCGDIKDLLEAVEEPMSPGRFAANFMDSFRFYRLRIPRDPLQAEKEFCDA